MGSVHFAENDARRSVELECGRPGEFRAMGGRDVRLTEDDLRQMAAGFDPVGEHLLKIGHREIQTDTPDFGRVTGLRYDGVSRRLLASVVPTPAGVDKNRREGFRRVSMELIRRSGKLVFDHLALLAAHPPAISGLAPVAFGVAPDRDGSRLSLSAAAASDPSSRRRLPAGISAAAIAGCARGLLANDPDLTEDDAWNRSVQLAESELEKLARATPSPDPESERLHLATLKLMKERPTLTYNLAADEIVRRMNLAS